MSEDNSRKNKLLSNLKEEWNLFWGTFTENKAASEMALSLDALDLSEQLEPLTIEQIRAMNRALSAERRKINQRLESLKKEIDLNSAKLEALKLVGGDIMDTEAKISELTDLGQSLSDSLSKVDEKIKFTRQFEDHFKRNPYPELKF